jgi:hypothetical protein
VRAFVCVIALAVPAVAAAQPLSPDDRGWKIRDQVTVERIDAVPSLVFRSGEAYFRDMQFRDGTITFDLRTTPRRAFLGLRFRAASEERFEEIYFRPHKSGLPDTVQYAPAFSGGRSQWQLYHGPAETAAAVFTHGTWTPVRIVVRDRQAAVFLGTSAEPVMVVNRLAHDPAPGFIGFWCFDMGDVAPGEQTTAVSNIVVKPNEVGYSFPAAKPVQAPAGSFEEWEVSAPFSAPEGAVLTLPVEVLRGTWQKATTEPDGLLPFDRVVKPPAGARRASVLARVRLNAPQPRRQRINLGFSDDVSVFLNGVLLYSGVNGYSYNYPRRDGLITIDQASLDLPLRAGENEVIFAVSDTFGGWAIMAQTDPP